MSDAEHPDVDVNDHSELEGMAFYGKPVLELDKNELRSLVVHLNEKVGHLEERKMTPEQWAEHRLSDAGTND